MTNERLAHWVLWIFESRVWAVIVVGLVVVNLWHGEVYAAVGNVAVWLLIFSVGRKLRQAERDFERQRAEIEATFDRGPKTLQ